LTLTLRKVRSGDYRVNFPNADDSAAYYTDNLEDAVNAAVEMARKGTDGATERPRPRQRFRYRGFLGPRN